MPTEKEKKATLHEELINQFSTLITSGFGVVVALAWNDAIQNFVKEYVEPRIPGSGLSAQFFYAVLITVVIVFITYFLSKISAKFQANKNDQEKS
jgi:uncharacterized membrane protein required for colicin V production